MKTATVTKAKTKLPPMPDETTNDSAPIRAVARDPVQRANAREEGKREVVRAAPPGALTFTHPVTGELLVRAPGASVSGSAFDFPMDQVPDGFTYQWCRKSTYGEEDRPNMLARNRSGWRAVPAERHPDRPVELDGLVLMEAPTIFVEAARREERLRARSESTPSAPKVENLPSGFDDSTGGKLGARNATFARRNKAEATDPSLRPNLRREIDIDE